MNDIVSITVTTKNEEKNIARCLESIKLQTYKSVEVIVVDNNSGDRTVEISRAFTNLVFNMGPERSSQRNYGMIEKSSGKFVMFVDADMVLSPFLIEDCVSMMEKGAFFALYIPEIVLGRSFWSKVRRFERSFYNGTVIDGARFFKKDSFIETGGFDLSMSGPEDWDIDKMIKKRGRIGLLKTKGKTVFLNNWPLKEFVLSNGANPDKYGSVIFHNESEFDIKRYLEKKGYYSRSFDVYKAKWGKDDPDIKKQFGLIYRFLIVFIEKGKILKILSHPILFLSVIFLRILVGFTYINRKGIINNE